MWLRVFFFSNEPGILAAVGIDGNIYFMASDVGSLLGYRNVYHFARKYATKNLLDFIPHDFLPRHYRLYKNGIPVFDFVDMIATIRKTFRNHKIKFDEQKISQLTSLWYFGSVIENYSDCPPSLSNSPKYANSLYVKSHDKTCMSVQEWIRQFVKNVQRCFVEDYSNKTTASILLDFFNKKRKIDDNQSNEMKRDDEKLSYDSFSAPPSVDVSTCRDLPSTSTEENINESLVETNLLPSTSTDRDFMETDSQVLMENNLPPSTETSNLDFMETEENANASIVKPSTSSNLDFVENPSVDILGSPMEETFEKSTANPDNLPHPDDNINIESLALDLLASVCTNKLNEQSISKPSDNCFKITFDNFKFTPDKICINSGNEKFIYVMQKI